jgi:hypothetical protein
MIDMFGRYLYSAFSEMLFSTPDVLGNARRYSADVATGVGFVAEVGKE